MPLFESQESKSSRIFNAVAETFLSRLANVGLAEDQLIYGAWFTGGATTAQQALNYCKCLKNAWGKGSEEKALALINVFIVPMICRWYKAKLENGQEIMNDKVSYILALLGNKLGNSILFFTNLGKQFNYESELLEGKINPPKVPESLYWVDVFQYPEYYQMANDQIQYLGKYREKQLEGLDLLQKKQQHRVSGNKGVMVIEACFLIAKACEVCGKSLGIDWDRLSFPVEYIGENNAAIPRERFPLPDDVTPLIPLMKVGTMTMFGFRDMLRS